MEIWKSVVGYEGLYEVSNFGRVKSLERIQTYSDGRVYTFRDRILTCSINKCGYNLVKLFKNTVYQNIKVHRLVAEAFIPNPENKPQVNHINGKKSDNRVENLEWVTAKENMVHAHKIGIKKSLKGEKHGMCKLKKQEVFEIKYGHKSKTIVEISKIYGIHFATVSKIRRGVIWPDV